MIENKKSSPLFIKVNPADNVAIVVNEGGLPAGSAFADGLVLLEAVPQGHKVALSDIDSGAAVVRYGEIIGHATRRLPKGSWVEESSVDLPSAPDLDSLPLATLSVPPAEKIEGLFFDGYRNADGSVGSKNLLGLIPSVQCVAGVLQHAASRIEKELLPRYPHVDGVVALNHSYGCGVAITAPDAEIPIRTIRNLAAHPNFGGQALFVGLGCEKLQPERIAPAAAAAGCADTASLAAPAVAAAPASGASPCGIIRLQEEAGFDGMVARILALAEERLAILEKRRREPCPLSDLVVGVQCGGSDAFSGVTANPAIGYASDLLVRAGATVMFSEVTEVRDAIHLLTPRAATPAVGAALVREMKWYDAYLARGGADRSANPAPGNKKGGLANIVEKSLGSIAKSGRSQIAGVLGPGELAKEKGLIFAATPASDFICGTLQLASGIHLQVFSTGRGTPYGLAMAPVIKVASRSYLARQWPDLIDIDAGKIATGDASVEEVGAEIFQLIIDAASGRKKPWADIHGIRNDLVLFNPAPVT